jgi:hypothetical protein
VGNVESRRSTYRVLVGKLEGKRLLGRSGHGIEDNIKMDVKEVGWDGMRLDSSGSVGKNGRLYERCNEPLGSIN